MGRKKIKIEAKEDSYDQSVTYGKRRNGLLKKAKELSLLCDVPLVLLFSSPRNKDSYQAFLGEQRYYFALRLFILLYCCIV
jgi:SRF-type transcription factor (DNA-binding and dimerisation domain)